MIKVVETFISSDKKIGCINCVFFEDKEIKKNLMSDREIFEGFHVEMPKCGFAESEPHFRTIFVDNPKDIEGIKFVSFYD